MKKSILAPLFILILAALTFAQTPSSTPPPADNPDVVKISTTLIQLDVTVTDKKGNIIRDLRPEEIEIYENGEKQEIANFSFISASAPSDPVANGSRPEKNTALLPPKAVRPEQVRRTIALVVDDLSLSFPSVQWTRHALRKFVNEQMQEGDLVAIIRTGAGIGALQQFTTDKRQLLAAIEKVTFNLGGTSRTGVFNPIESTLNEERNGDQANSDLRDTERELNEFRESVFATGTLGAVNFIVRGMRDLPGRKSVMLLSDGFRLYTTGANGVPQGSRILTLLRRLTDLANRASVVIYTLDPRGLAAPGLMAEDDVSGLDPGQVESRLNDRSNDLFETQQGLRFLAQQTGGFSVINNNDLPGSIRRVLDDQSYYLIGYEPDSETFDPKVRRYNKLVVKVKREGARVRYRSGFFGITDEQMERPVQLTAAQTILNALTSPFAMNEIPLRLNALFAGDEKQQSVIRSYVHIKGSDLSFNREPDGSHKAEFEVVALSFGDNGVVIDELTRGYTLTVKDKDYRRIQEKGFVYYFGFPIKKAGGYQMRVVVRDKSSNKVGSANQFIEIPNLKKKRLMLSGIVLENFTADQWKRFTADPRSYKEISEETDALTDTALRQFKRGTVLRFGYEIYNSKIVAGQKPNLSIQARIFRDGKLYHESPPKPFNGNAQSTASSLNPIGVINLGEKMEAGEYILQIIVTDNLAKEKRKTATQFAQFEIVE
jgi:VWFA-related protein